MNNNDLPPLPAPGASGPHVCETIRLYLAILHDLPPELAERVVAHTRTCEACAEELRQLNRTTELMSNLGESLPSAHVDSAILALARTKQPEISTMSAESLIAPVRVHDDFLAHFLRRIVGALLSRPSGRPGVDTRAARQSSVRRRSPLRVIGALVAAVIVLAMIPMVQFFTGSFGGNTNFALPSNLSWSGYVVYYTQTKMGSQHVPYQINCYDDLGSGHMHVETKMDASLDVVAVGDASKMLGMDMIHHVAQWGADAWKVDDSMLNLARLRADLAAKRAVYLGKGSFNGQDVYRIQGSTGHVLLLDMQYRPVNILESSSSGGANKPMYDVFKLLPAAQVSADMWNMSVPPGFTMGMLPRKP